MRLKPAWAALMLALCSCASLEEPKFEGGLSKESDASEKHHGRILHQSVWIKCSAPWGTRCYYELPAHLTPPIPEGYVYCNTKMTPREGPNEDAKAWFRLENRRVKVYTRACGGPWYDRYESYVRMDFDTYIVRDGAQNDPQNNCRYVRPPDLKCF